MVGAPTRGPGPPSSLNLAWQARPLRTGRSRRTRRRHIPRASRPFQMMMPGGPPHPRRRTGARTPGAQKTPHATRRLLRLPSLSHTEGIWSVQVAVLRQVVHRGGPRVYLQVARRGQARGRDTSAKREPRPDLRYVSYATPPETRARVRERVSM